MVDTKIFIEERNGDAAGTGTFYLPSLLAICMLPQLECKVPLDFIPLPHM